MEMGIFNITQWVYFTFNYPEPKQMFAEVFGSLSDHIYNKWLSYGGNFNRLFAELDRECQRKLAKYVIDNYHGVDGYKPSEK